MPEEGQVEDKRTVLEIAEDAVKQATDMRLAKRTITERLNYLRDVRTSAKAEMTQLKTQYTLLDKAVR